jgi:glycosyltransferase involved in cell wall biosynthesis
MKILLANSTCKRGGISTFMLSLRGALLALGHECELFFFQRGPMEAHLPAGARVHFGDLADCLTLVAQERFAVVHANNVDWTTGISAVREIGARLVVSSHQSRAGAWTYGWTAANCDSYVTVSRWLRDDLQPFTDLPIQVVFNGIDLSRFTPAGEREVDGVPAGDAPIVAWVGRGGSRQKALERFAAMAPACREAGLRICIVDQHPPERVEALHPGLRARLQPLADFWSGVAYEQMPNLYRRIAASGGCLVSTSRWEGLPLTLLEAQACGCPVVATDIPGTDECVFPDHGGTLYREDEDPADTAMRIVALLSNGEAMRGRGGRAGAHVRARFGLEGMAEQYVQVYREAPYLWNGSAAARRRGGRRLSPVGHWSGYLEQRWGVGHLQYDASRALAHAGRWHLAAASVRASLRTAPTLFLRPRRLAHLLRAGKRGRWQAPGAPPAAPALHSGSERT